MLNNYFRVAFRSFRNHKLFSLINIGGLAIGISASLVIYLIVQYEFSFDKSHKDGDRIYRAVSEMKFLILPLIIPAFLHLLQER
jgi:hypothetical protein